MRWEPPQPKPPEGGAMLSGQLDAQWAGLRNMTNLKRTPILGDEALRARRIELVHAVPRPHAAAGGS